jgi:hypothetical protein
MIGYLAGAMVQDCLALSGEERSHSSLVAEYSLANISQAIRVWTLITLEYLTSEILRSWEAGYTLSTFTRKTMLYPSTRCYTRLHTSSLGCVGAATLSIGIPGYSHVSKGGSRHYNSVIGRHSIISATIPSLAGTCDGEEARLSPCLKVFFPLRRKKIRVDVCSPSPRCRYHRVSTKKIYFDLYPLHFSPPGNTRMQPRRGNVAGRN